MTAKACYLVADLINEETEQNDTQRKRPDADSCETTSLCRVESKFSGPSIDKEHSGNKAEARGDEGDKTAPKDSFIVCVVVISHVSVFIVVVIDVSRCWKLMRREP